MGWGSCSLLNPNLHLISRRFSKYSCLYWNRSFNSRRHFQILNHICSSLSSPPFYASLSGGYDRHENYARGKRRMDDYQEEHARVLRASLGYVNRLGWNESALAAGAVEVGLSPSIVGTFSGKEATLVEFFMDECLEKLIDRFDNGEELKDLIPSKRIFELGKIRLEMHTPYISKWAEALNVQSRLPNLSASLKQRAILVDEIWLRAVGDERRDIDWHVKRMVLGGVLSAVEVYMLADTSSEFQDTWAFLDRLVQDAFRLKNTAEEVKHISKDLATAMGMSFMNVASKLRSP